ncbi:zinc finger protein ZPR1 [Anabrus simplex]|uniref:zinc finger protein ZPR1 n=1 Tax=Anabrus simplex TaxID=316456 RepID=UPI0035A3C332
MGEDKKQPLFRDLNADDPDPETTEIESLCMNCGENGLTRLLLTKIPFYKEIILMSFECEKCGFRNNEIQPGGEIQEKGIRIVVHVRSPSDLNRQVVKSDYTSVKIPELDFEIPSQSQKGEITTVEGVLDRVIAGLEQDQPVRRNEDPFSATQIDAFLEKLRKLKDLSTPFTLVLEDISGNSFVQNPCAPLKDPGAETTLFVRNKEQNLAVGIISSDEASEKSESLGVLKPMKQGDFTLEDLEGEVVHFSTNCPDCRAPCQTNMKAVKIPHFKEVLLMATTCDVCGHRTNEVKSGGGIEPKGLRIEVKIRGREDFSRDVLKSETCSLSIPELELEVGPFALGGRFTTIEGLLVAVKEQMAQQGLMFHDSTDEDSRIRLSAFLDKLNEVLSGEKCVTLVLDDPAGNSYVQNLTDQERDPNLSITAYERTFEHNEELGLNDMKTEGYEET